MSPSMVETAANGSNLLRPSNHLSSDPRNSLAQNNRATTMFSPASENIPPSHYEQLLALSNYAATNSFSAYPLYYGNVPQFEQLQQGVVFLPKPILDPLEGTKGVVVQDIPCHEDASRKNTKPGMINASEKQCKVGCDLSLRLGPLSVENKQLQDFKDVSSHEGAKFCGQLPVLDKGFSLLPIDNGYEALGSHKCVEETMRKRKAAFNNAMEDQQFCLKPKLPFSHLT